MPEHGTSVPLDRFPGVQPFSASQSFLFFGRQTDIEALLTLMFIRQGVVLYGKSGYGKSSLLNAGIIPRLRESGTNKFFTIRFTNFSEKEAGASLSPAQTLTQRLSEGIIPKAGNVTDSLIPDRNSCWYWIKHHQSDNPKASYILIFDQFEELFTYPKDQIDAFSEQLSELLYDTLPLKFKKKISEASKSNPLAPEDYEFLFDKPTVKVVFSIRSDRLALLNLLSDRHPAILQHCYELQALNVMDARQAIVEPARLPRELGFATPEFEFTDTALDKILKGVADPEDGKIESAALQMICQYAERTLVAQRNITVIDEESLGDVKEIFKLYYEAFLNDLAPDERPKAQQLIEDELIDGEKRNPLSATYIQNKFGLSDDLLNRLERSSLLRKERDAAGRILYEVSHDTLVAAIDKVAQGRRAAEALEKQRALERQILAERERAEELASLNQKARSRFRLAIGLVIISMVIAVLALYFRQQSIEALDLANEKKTEAETALFRNQLLEAQGLVDRAEGYMLNEEFGLALRELMQAKEHLKTGFSLNDGIEQERVSLEKIIDKRIETCQAQLKPESE